MRPAAAGWAIPAVTFLCLGVRAQLANDASGQATGWYSIRLGTHFDQAGAEAQRREVELGGHTPVFIVEDPPAYRVQFGRFDSLVEARMYRQGLAEAGVSSGPEVVDLAVNDPGAPPDYSGEIPSDFRLGEFSFGPPVQLWHGEVRMEDLPPLGGVAGARARLAVTPDAPASSVLSQGSGMAWARVRDPSLRDLSTRALIALLPVARGEQPVEPTERLRACWNAAEMMRSAGRHEEAYRAFRELRGVLQDDDDLAVCDAEIVRVHLRITRGVMPFLINDGTFDRIALHRQQQTVQWRHTAPSAAPPHQDERVNFREGWTTEIRWDYNRIMDYAGDGHLHATMTRDGSNAEIFILYDNYRATSTYHTSPVL